MDRIRMTETQLSACFDSGTFHRGKAYFKAGHVKRLEVKGQERDVIRLQGKVSNGRGRSYTTFVTLSHRQRDDLLNGNCNCPVGFNCKHSVALALTWLEQSATRSDRDDGASITPDTWLQHLQALTQTNIEPSDLTPKSDVHGAAKPQLFFELSLNAEQTLTLSIAQYRLLKNGAYGKPYYFKPFDFSPGSRAIGALDEAVFALAKEWVPFLEQSWSSERTFLFKGSVGWVVLQSLLKTERCVYQTLSQPVALGEDRTVLPYWEETPQQKYRLLLGLSQGRGPLLSLSEGCGVYLDLAQGLIGRVEKRLSPAQQSLLSQAPVLSLEHLLKAGPYLQQLWPGMTLPDNLKDTQIEVIENVSPVPEIFLETQALGEHRGKVRFNYEGVWVSADEAPQPVVVQDGFLYQVHRDLTQEQAALAALQEAGLRPDGQGLWHPEAADAHEMAEHWLHFLRENTHWEIYDEAFDFKVLAPDAWQAEIRQTGQDVGSDWFQLDLGIEVEGNHYDLRPFLIQLLQRYPGDSWQRALTERQEVLLRLPGASGHWLALDSERVTLMLKTLLSIYDQESLGTENPLKLGFFDALSLDALLGLEDLAWLGAEALKTLTHQLKHFDQVLAVPPPKGLQATLRSYQQVGLNWLQFLRQFGFHGILADDMGLGKTLQTLSHLLVEKQAGRLGQALIVAPTSVVTNWQREAERFCPELRVLCFVGPNREFDALKSYDLVITSYALWRRDSERHRQKVYTWLILDEAQNIKNPRSKGAQIAYQQPAHHRLCLTGTPMENHLGELWSLFHFLMPGFLGNAKQFKERFQDPIEKNQDQLRQQALRQRLTPFLLRRHKTQVEQDLPPKTEIVQKITLSKKQRDFYETLRAAMHQEVQAEIADRGLKKSQFFILEALLKLRQVCCSPALVPLKAAEKLPSAKLEYVLELVQTLAQEGRRMLIFSQFVSMLDLIAAELCQAQIDYEMLTGSTRQRDKVIERFQTGTSPVFLISLKAGGVGINLTAADTVIHYDPWWNPAVERQATDRSWRLGQDKKVFVYKLIAEDTIEEKILQLQARKQRLADSIESEGTPEELRISQTDLLKLLGE